MLLLAALAVVGCSAPRAPAASPSSTRPALAVMPSANEFTSAVEATRSLGTADVNIDVEVSAPTGPRALRATGAAVLSRGRADLTWTSAAGTFRELVNDQAIFTQERPPDGPWIRTAYPGTTPTSGYADTLRGLSGLRDVTLDGTQDLRGVTTSRYVGWLPAVETELTALGLTPIEAAEVLRAQPDARVSVTVWLDSHDHVVQVARELTPVGADDPGVRATTSFTDFSVLLNLNSPRGNVQDASST